MGLSVDQRDSGAGQHGGEAVVGKKYKAGAGSRVITIVVYFDQQMDALHAIRWSKSSFSVF